MSEHFVKQKKLAALAHKDSIRTVVLGSSHAYFGFNPKYFSKSFNIATTSQDLYGSLFIYKWILNRITNVRNVIVFYSLFSSGFDTINSNQKEHAEIYRRVFTDKVRNANKDNILEFKKSGFRGYRAHGEKAYLTASAAERVRGHTKYSELGQYSGQQNEHLIEASHLAKINGHKFYVVIPPARRDYIACLDEKIDYFSTLRNIAVSQNFIILDFFNSKIFSDEDFGDTDHLNHVGAKKLTIALNQAINFSQISNIPFLQEVINISADFSEWSDANISLFKETLAKLMLNIYKR
jgi:hypothetical protein